MAEHNDLGKSGEKQAGEFLEAKGYKIIARNWRSGAYELDLVVRKNDMIVIAEVKTRSGFIDHVDDVLPAMKEIALREAAEDFMNSFDEDCECRIDLLILEKKASGFFIRHIENAVEPT